MSVMRNVSGALAASLVLFVAGCPRRAAPPGVGGPGADAPAPEGMVAVTVHVKDMTKVLKIG